MIMGYYITIPTEIRKDNRLRANEKILYGEILALSNKQGYCTAINEDLAELYGVTTRIISLWISNLVEHGYLHREMVREGNKPMQRRLWARQGRK